MNVDSVLPPFPDFLNCQIRRMNAGAKVELPKGGIERAEMTTQEQNEAALDHKFEEIYGLEPQDIYKELKGKVNEQVYIESEQKRLLFTNSCWEIQRVNPLKGGNLIFEEWYRLRHIGTGKFLAVDDDGLNLILRSTASHISCLFRFKSEMSNKKEVKYQDEDGDGYLDRFSFLHPNQRVII